MMDKCAPGSLDEIVSNEGAIGLLAFGESDNYDNAVVIQGQGIASLKIFVLVGRKWLLPSSTGPECIQDIVQMIFQFRVESQGMVPTLLGHVYLMAVPVSYHPLSVRIGQGAYP